MYAAEKVASSCGNVLNEASEGAVQCVADAKQIETNISISSSLTNHSD
jgi:hypothetical protein